MNTHFSHCNLSESEMVYNWHTFKNGKTHIICHCKKCNQFVGYVPQQKPYTEWVNGIYVTTPKEPKSLSDILNEPRKNKKQKNINNPAKDTLITIINLPGIEKYIGMALYEQGRKVCK